MKKPGLTEQRHSELGAELSIIRHRLLQLAVELGNAYPKTSPERRYASEAYQAVDNLRYALEDRTEDWHLYTGRTLTDEEYAAAWERIVGDHRARRDAHLELGAGGRK